MRASTIEEFLDDPIERYVIGPSWVHCVTRDRFVGTLLHGAVTGPDARELLPLVAATHDAIPPHVVLVDGLRVRELEPAAFSIVAQYIDERRDHLRGRILKLAGVRAPGLPGAVAEGFYRMVNPPYPVEVFSQRNDALAWLGATAFTDLLDELEAIAVGGPMTIVDQLAVQIRHQLDASIAEAARKLGLSVRTLQRRLRDENTTFQEQLDLARVSAAQELLSGSDLPIGKIAIEVGCASSATFCVMFRRLTGHTPNEWRSLHRRDG